jgi:hypothetical protein
MSRVNARRITSRPASLPYPLFQCSGATCQPISMSCSSWRSGCRLTPPMTAPVSARVTAQWPSPASLSFDSVIHRCSSFCMSPRSVTVSMAGVSQRATAGSP